LPLKQIKLLEQKLISGNKNNLGKPSKKKQEIVWFFTKHGGYPPTIENQTYKGFLVFSEEKTGNWSELWGGGGVYPPFGKKPNYFPFFVVEGFPYCHKNKFRSTRINCM
jgi:hypothetical protein